MSEGGAQGDGRKHINADRLRGGKSGAEVIVYDIYGGEVRVDGDNGVEEALTVGRAAVLVPTSYSTSILSPPIVHLTRECGRSCKR